MKLSQVEAFRAVMLSGSTTAAAGMLHTAQPNVSRLISQLEKDTGLRLFERQPGKLVPTEEGLAFFNEVQRTFVGLQHLDATAKRIKRFGTGLLRIAAIQTLALGLIPRAVKRFAEQHPDVTLSIHTGHSTLVDQWVNAQFCDIGVVSQVSGYGYSQVEALYCVAGVCLLPAGHRLVHKDVIAPDDLRDEPFVSLARNDGLRVNVDRAFDEAGVSRKITIESSYSSIICSLVALGMGVSIVNPLVAQDYRHTGVVTRPFVPAVPYEISLLFPKGRPENRLAERFVGILREVVREERETLGV